MQVLSVNKSSEKGPKKPVKTIRLDRNGVIGDVHNATVRPVSIIDQYHIDKFQELTGSRNPEYGEFAENITITGLGDEKITILDQFVSGEVRLEVVQTGKPFHESFKELGNYVMPRTGIFCRVLQEGTLVSGTELELIKKVFKIWIVTLSDRASKGIYEDKSGPMVKEMVQSSIQKKGFRMELKTVVIPDDPGKLESILQSAKDDGVDILITTGGTGIGPRDITVETVRPHINQEIPGIMEMIRIKYGHEKPNALLSRGIAGVMDQTLVYTLPGSVKAVREYMTEIQKTLIHLIYMLHDIDVH